METVIRQLNDVGVWFTQYSWEMLLQSSLLIAVLFVVDFAIRKKVRAVFRYGLLLLVLVKLVLPCGISSPVSLGYLIPINELSVSQKTPPAVQPNNIVNNINVEIAAAQLLNNTTNVPVNVTKPANPPQNTVKAVAETALAASTVSRELVTWQAGLFLLWAVAVIVMFTLLIQRIFFVRSLVRQSKNASERMDGILTACSEQLNIKRKFELKVSPNATSPAVCGLFNPVILIPENINESIGQNDLRAILLHELSHIKRGDLWINTLQTILQIAYFYNPLLWIANELIRRVREQAVDEVVMVTMGKHARQYPQTLLNVAMAAFGRPALSLRLIGVVESKKTLKTRVERMLKMPIPKTAKIGLLGFAAIFIIAAILIPMAVADQLPEFVIKGKVIDATTGKPIAGVKVGDTERYANGSQNTVTDSNGNYSYKTWYEEHDVKAEAAGYKRQDKGFGTKLFGSEKEKVINFALDVKGTSQNTDYSSVTVTEGVGFDNVIVGDPNCTKEFIKSKLGKLDDDKMRLDYYSNGFFLDYRNEYGLDFWLDKDNVLREIRLNPGFKGKLTSGISMSSSKEDVFRIYGKPIKEVVAGDSDFDKGFGDKVLYSRKGLLGTSEISRIYYNKDNHDWLLFWFKGDKINQIVTFSGRPENLDAQAKQTDNNTADIIVADGVGFDNIVVGDSKCTGEFIKAKLGVPNNEEKDTKTNGLWLDYRKKYGFDFWINQNDTLHEIRLNHGFKGKLTSGISMSSSRQDVFKTYGSPTLVAAEDFNILLDDQVLLYRNREISKIYYNSKGLLFWFEGDKISQIVTFPTQTQKSAVQDDKNNDSELKSRLQNLVEDFFKDNYRDITARKAIEWGKPVVDANGCMSIRYKYEATIWDSEKVVNDEIFTFDKNGKFASVKKMGLKNIKDYENIDPASIGISVYKVNKKVSSYPAKVDFSRPEYTYVLANRIIAEGNEPGWPQISASGLSERMKKTNSQKKSVDPNVTKKYLETEILQVYTKGNYASVIASFPGSGSGYDIRSFKLENGKWLNIGEDIMPTLKDVHARAAFMLDYNNYQEKLLQEAADPNQKPAVNNEKFGSSVERKVAAIGPGWETLKRIIGDNYRGSIGGYNSDEAKCSEYFNTVLSWASPGDTFLMMFAFDDEQYGYVQCIPKQYDDLLPKPWSEIKKMVESGQTVELKGKARGFDTIVLAAPTYFKLEELIKSTELLSEFKKPNIHIEPSESKIVPDEKFTAKLPSGATVELVGICDYSSDTPQFRKPDGTEPNEKLYIKRERDYINEKYGFIIKVNGPQDLNFTWNKIQSSDGYWGSCAVLDESGNTIKGYQAAITKNLNADTTDIRVGVANEPWQTIVTHNGKSMTTTGNKNIIFSQAYESGNFVAVTVSSPWTKDATERIVAIDNDGKIHTAGSIGSVASGEIDQMTAKFYGIKLGDIKEFAFQNRPYQFVTFKNVSLRHNKKTDVKIEAEKPAGQDANEKLAGDLSAEEFSHALLGNWRSVYRHPNAANILQANFQPDGSTKLTITENNLEKIIAGSYQIQFERQPQSGMITFAQIIVQSDNGNFKFSRVNFGLHNGVTESKGLLLRIDTEPYGTLEKVSPTDILKDISEGKIGQEKFIKSLPNGIKVEDIEAIIKDWIKYCRNNDFIAAEKLWHPEGGFKGQFKENREVFYTMDPNWQFDGISEIIIDEPNKIIAISNGTPSIDKAYSEKSFIYWNMVKIDSGQWKINNSSWIQGKQHPKYKSFHLMEEQPNSRIWINESKQNPGSNNKTANNNGKFTKTLPNGVTVELIGVSEYPSKGKQWWRPDGSPLGFNIETQDNSNYTNNATAYEIAYKISVPSDVTVSEFPHIKGSVAQSGLSIKNPADLSAIRVHIDKWGKSTTVDFPIADGQWKTLGSASGGQSISYVGKRKLMFSPATGTAEQMTITISDDLEEFDDYRLIAIDKQGNTHTGNRNWFSNNNMRQNTFTFDKLDTASVERFEFQTRPFSNVEFKNVSLKPNFKTSVAANN